MLTAHDHGDVRELRLDRPPANALSPELLARLLDAVREASESEARALVLSGRERLFSAGLDVPLFLGLDRAGVCRAWSDFFDVMKALATSPIPTIAALTGHAPAGGCVLALFCDWRVMAEGGFKIGLNEVQLGLRMPRVIHGAARYVVGARSAERLCCTAELIPGEEALRIGLVDELVAPEAVLPRALERGRAWAALPPNALRKTRASARRELWRAFDSFDDEQLELFLDDWYSRETQNAMRALVERLGKKA